MKIAYIITGHLRTIDKCHRSFFDNIYKENSDIYVHTWDSEDSKIKVWHKHKFKEKYDIEKKIKDIYKTENYIIENQDLTINTQLKKRKVNVSNISHYYSFYSLIKCFEMIKQSGKKYDIIFKLRPDIFFKKQIINLNEGFNIGANLVEWDDTINGDWRKMKAIDIIYYGSYDNFETLYDNREVFFEKVRNNDSYIFHNYFDTYLKNVNLLEYYYNKHWKIQR